MTQYYIAVDGGGSKTHALCADENQQVIGEGYSGPTSLAATTVGAASFNLREAIRQATEGLDAAVEYNCLVMGLAGMDTPTEEMSALQIFKEVLSHMRIKRFVLVNDSVIALAGGTDKPNALVLIAGTGSNCFGRNEQGQTAKTSGMDYILTDEGSGFDIGQLVLKSAVRSYDGRGQKTILEKMVCEYFRIPSINELKGHVYHPVLTKPEIAELSKMCEEAFDQGDAVAKTIFDHAVAELALMVTTVIKRLNIMDKDVDCVVVGGINKVPYVKERLQQQLSLLYPRLTLVTPHNKPVYGALKMAIHSKIQP